MPINEKYVTSFKEENFYHLYSKAIGTEKLFLSNENKRFFLEKFTAYTTLYFNTYAYNILDNHFHFLIKTCAESELQKNLQRISERNLKKHQLAFLNQKITYEQELEFQFKDLLISYAQAFNKANSRVGPLFTNPFRRVLVDDENHFTNLIIYIHCNTVKHHIDKDFENHIWSSYQNILSDTPTLLKRKEILDWFGGKENFRKAHLQNGFYYNNPYSIEE